ncbi:hypothetical protein NXC12_PD00460 (plasmid) [Rhizobium etli]|uniref:Uncharacterized protein n=1 Tax=Rhizobium etli TaxID=29449 RepID=A0AAN1BND9_RHIET|nr:hypothetical protein NXC12_PD00460 [Rhizobium etli]
MFGIVGVGYQPVSEWLADAWKPDAMQGTRPKDRCHRQHARIYGRVGVQHCVRRFSRTEAALAVAAGRARGARYG